MVAEIDRAVDRYCSDKLVAISLRVGHSLRRRYPEPTASHKAQIVTATFSVDWNLGDYLRRNYDDGVSKNLGSMGAVTDELSGAQYCTVAQYFK
ncbi:hypothetical protein B0T24DRAFT_613340 [Lasiosphaeria ovina]|uniref:Uncharacterized protein n=1 Tax=Lasiosphaeria ovina TaxID=92902 RepID=A0AAE0TTE5_9PEZI|nr:hypothetical protein B0T24DRAFT_613340 [Lasiosphaeria ovina]